MQTIMILTVCRTADQSTLKTTNETLSLHRYIRRRLDDYGRTSEAVSRHAICGGGRQSRPVRSTYVGVAVCASAVSVLLAVLCR